MVDGSGEWPGAARDGSTRAALCGIILKERKIISKNKPIIESIIDQKPIINSIIFRDWDALLQSRLEG